MFFRKKSVAVVDKPTMVPQAQAVVIEGSDERFEAYVELATKLGTRNGALILMMILRFCQREEICVYPLDQVERFMNRTYPVKGGVPGWYWYPLRTHDVGKISRRFWHQNGHIPSDARYNGEVPLNVLHLVDRLSQAVPEAHFFIGATYHPEWEVKGDPFLAVGATGMELIVLERWDEPGFHLNVKG